MSRVYRAEIFNQNYLSQPMKTERCARKSARWCPACCEVWSCGANREADAEQVTVNHGQLSPVPAWRNFLHQSPPNYQLKIKHNCVWKQWRTVEMEVSLILQQMSQHNGNESICLKRIPSIIITSAITVAEHYKMYIKALLLFFAPGFIVIGDSHDQWRVRTGKFKFSE